jgi:hypothetical protein
MHACVSVGWDVHVQAHLLTASPAPVAPPVGGRLGLTLLLALFTACGGHGAGEVVQSPGATAKPRTAPTPPEQLPSATPSASAPTLAAAPSAIPASSALPGSVAAPSAAPAQGTVAEDLLQVTAARVNVSSTVSGAQDFPEDLLDGDPASAWQSRTGDLQPWIRIELPPEVQVERVELTAGYTLSVGRKDLFTQNYRVTEVTVHRDGTELGRYALDPMQRSLQPLPITGPGGVYEVRVTRSLPGTRPEWRAIAMSELRVIGRAGAARLAAPKTASIEVGHVTPETVEGLLGLTVREANAPGQAFASVDALCADFIARAPSTLEVPGETPLRRRGRPRCEKLPSRYALPASDTYLSLTAQRTFDGFSGATRLALQLPRGFVWLPLGLGLDNALAPRPPGSYGPDKVASIRIENEHLVLTISAPGERQLGNGGLTGALWCKEHPGQLTCREYDPTNAASVEEFRITRDGQFHPH